MTELKRISFFIWPEILGLAKKAAQEDDDTLSDYLRALVVEDLEKKGLLDKDTLLKILKRR